MEYLGTPCEMLPNEFPTLRACLRYGSYIKEHALAMGDKITVREIAKQVFKKVSSFYARANAKFVPQVTLTEYSLKTSNVI